jgi:hypothetical protein
MLRPPSDYELTKVNLSSQSAKIDDLYFDSAIIFFIPKVADKGVDLTNLQCTIVQIIDRGEWGKEEVSFTVEASSFSNRKRREFYLSADAKYSLKIIPPSELRMGILEIYFDPTFNSFDNLPNMGVSNPSSTDPDAIAEALLAITPQLAQAIGAQTAGGVQQALANQSANIESKNSETDQKKIQPWSGDINNHLVLDPNRDRLGVHIMHPGKKLNNQNTSEVFIVVGSADNRDQDRWDYLVLAQGEYNSEPERETLPVYAWVAANKPAAFVTVTEYLP